MKIQTTLFFLLLSSFLIAQDVLLFEDTKAETLVFSTSNTSASLQQILRTLEPQHGHNASFDLYYEYNCRLVEKPSYLFADLHFEALSVNHATNLRGFSFDDLLLPPSVTLTINLLAGDEVVHSVCESVSLKNLNQASIHFNYSDIQPSTVYTLVIKDLNFNYGSTQIQAVNQRKSAINQYYQAADDLRKISSNINSLEEVNPDPDRIYTVRDNINEWASQFEKIDKASFWTILPLQGNRINDPEEIRNLRNEVAEELNNVQAWLKELIDNIHELFYEKGVTLFEDKQISAAKTAFQKSVDAAKQYAPSHYFLAHIDFNEGFIDKAGERIIRVLNEYNPDQLTRQNGEELARHIMGFYFEEGQRAVDAGHYPEGVDFYRHAQAFGQNIRGFQFGQEEAESRIREAYYLDFHHQLDEVVLLQRQGNPQQALINMEQALAFQTDFRVNSTFDTYALHRDIVLAAFNDKLKHTRQLSQNKAWDEAIVGIQDAEIFLTSYNEFIQDKRQWLNLKTDVYTGKHQSLFQLATASKANGKLDKALEEATNALAFATQNKLSESLIYDSNQQINQIQKARYQRFLQGGNKARQQQQFAEALNQYEAAKKLENSLVYLPVSLSLEQKLKGTALQEIKRQYDTVMQKFINDNTNLAKTFANIQDLSGHYYLTLEPEVKTIYQQLQDQQCTNAKQILMPALEQDLAQYQQAADYPNARNTMEGIKILLNDYPGCGLSNNIVRDQSASIAICANYQETLEAAQKAETAYRFRTALDHYIYAKELYANPLVSARLDDHPAFHLYEYIINHPNNDMVMAGANLYLDQREHDACLSLLKSLIARGIPPKRTKNLQERLGSALAVRNYVASANWKVAFGAFVAKHERKNYRDMQRAFRKQWNRMG